MDAQPPSRYLNPREGRWQPYEHRLWSGRQLPKRSREAKSQVGHRPWPRALSCANDLRAAEDQASPGSAGRPVGCSEQVRDLTGFGVIAGTRSPPICLSVGPARNSRVQQMSSDGVCAPREEP